jgi:hypothetical protein
MAHSLDFQKFTDNRTTPITNMIPLKMKFVDDAHGYCTAVLIVSAIKEKSAQHTNTAPINLTPISTPNLVVFIDRPSSLISYIVHCINNNCHLLKKKSAGEGI